MRHQRCRVESTASHESEHRLEIPSFGPAHEASRIIDALLLVHRVVPPRPVTARYLEGEFLAIEVIAPQMQAGDADQHDPTPLAAHCGRGANRLVIIRGERKQDGIRAVPRGEVHYRTSDIDTLRGRDRPRAETLGKPE